jgi:hypothetical protein
MLTTKSILLLVTALFACSSAFVSPSTQFHFAIQHGRLSVLSRATAADVDNHHNRLGGTAWNFNEGQAPWGLKKNAEIWNGRVSQVRKIQTDNNTTQALSFFSLAGFCSYSAAGVSVYRNQSHGGRVGLVT